MIREKYKLTTDSSGQYFIIPEFREFDWEEWIDSEESYNGWAPDYAEYVGRPSDIVFENYKIIG